MFHVEQFIPDRRFLSLFVEGAGQLGWTFSEGSLLLFWQYYKELCQWESLTNLTSLKHDEKKIVLLLLDSLGGGTPLKDKEGLEVIDIGSGAGIPGIPLQIAVPGARFTLVEARAKKSTFLLNVVGKLKLSGTKVRQQRVEDIAREEGSQKKWDVAMVKGVNISQIIPSLKNILKATGKLMAFRAPSMETPDHLDGMHVCQENSYELPFGYGKRVVQIMEFD